MRFNIFLDKIWLYLFNNDIIATLACNGRIYASPNFLEMSNLLYILIKRVKNGIENNVIDH